MASHNINKQQQKKGGTAPSVSVLSGPVKRGWATVALLECNQERHRRKRARLFHLKGLLFVVSSFACAALLFAAPESRILLPRVATVRLFYDKGV